MDWVIKFLVGASLAMKWERLFALSAKKHADATTKLQDSHSYFSMLKAKVKTLADEIKYSVAPKWFLHPLN